MANRPVIARQPPANHPPGAIFASSNAALMRAQMGDTEGAMQEVTWTGLSSFDL